jgi:protein tyrosine/serine phosphatase
MMRVYYRLNAGRWQKASALALLSMFVLAGTATAGGKRTSGKTAPTVKIDNFGQMDERFFRGAQPDEDDYTELAALGIKTIFDLRNKTKGFEKQAVEAAGMRYVSIPMSDSRRPATEQIDQFLKLVDDPTTGKFFVHCVGGRHRTGVMGFVYRVNHYGWSFDQAYNEMKQYDFYTRFGHGDLKDFVREYAVSFVKKAALPAVVVDATPTSGDSTSPKTP